MATYTGTTGADTHTGTGGNDSISGLGGDDVLNGGAGADTVNGGSGNDRLNGGQGNDTIIGGVGTDTAVYAHTAASGEAPVASWSPTGVLTITTVADGADTLNSVEFVEFAGVTFTVNNTARNIVARIIDDTVNGGENDASISGNVLSNDVDLDSVLTVTGLVGGSLGVAMVGAHGSLTLNANGTFSYVPNGTSSGADTFTYQVMEAGATRTAVLTVNVADVNDTPVAVDASTTILEDAPFTGSVAGDASDEESTTFTFSTVSGPSHATAFSLNADGTFSYTPAANFHGTDSFTYQIMDGGGATDTATFTFTVTSVNDAPIAQDVSAGGYLEDSAGVTASVQFYSSDVDNDTRVVTHINGQAIAAGETVNVTNGTVTLLIGGLSPGDLLVTPNANFVGNVTFGYTVSDGALSDDGEMSIGFVNVNDAPVADGASQSGAEDNAITGTLSASDIDAGDSLTFGLSTGPTNGSVEINANGTFTYTPNADYNGPDSFTFEVTDAAGLTSTAVYSLTVTPVNDAPLASPVSQSFNEDLTTVINVLDFIGDFDGDSLTVTQIDGAPLTEDGVAVDGGVVTLITSGPNSGNLLFTPTADYNGAVSFEYTVSDGTLTATNTVDLTIVAVNDAPRAADFTLSTAEDSLAPTLIDLPSVDVDGEAITVSIGGNDLTVGETVAVTGGSVTFNIDGDLEFTPGADFNGTVDFDYVLTSGGASAGTDLPWGTFSDPADYDAVEIFGSRIDHSGIHVGGVPGQYFPQEDLTTSQFEALLGRASGLTDTSYRAAGLKFTADVNAGAVLSFDYEGYSQYGDNELYLFVDAPGTDNDETILIGDGNAIGNFSYTIQGDGFTTFVVAHIDNDENDSSPQAYGGYHHLDNFMINGVEGLSDTGHVTITVSAVNDAPTASPVTQTAAEDVLGGVVLDVQAASDDVDQDNLTVSFINGEALTEDGVAVTGGRVTLTTGGNLLFAPAPDYNGAPSFSYTVTDGTLDATSTVNLTITAVDDAPRAEDFTGSTTEDEVAPTVIALPSVDADGEAITVSIGGDDLVVGVPVTVTGGSVVLNEDGDLEFTPGPNFSGDASFNYTLTSGATAGVTTSWGALDDVADVANIALLGSFGYGSIVGDGELLLNGQLGVSNAELTAFAGHDAQFNEDFTWSAAKVVVHLEAGEEFTVDYTTGGNGGDDYLFTFINGNAPMYTNSGNSAGVFSYTATVAGDYTFVFASGDLDYSGGAAALATLDNLAIDGVPLSVSTGTAGLSDTATVTIAVSGVNDQPTAADLNLTMAEDQDFGLVIDLPGAGSDADAGTVLTIATINGEAIGPNGVQILGGTLTLITDGADAGKLRFSPEADYNADVSFEYTLSDGSGLPNGVTLTHTVDIDITSVNDDPVAAADASATLNEDGVYEGDLSLVSFDVDSETLTYSVFSQPNNGLVEMLEDGTFTYTPDSDYFGDDSFQYLVEDGDGGSTVGNFTFSVIGSNDAPTAESLELGMLEDQDGGLVIDLLGPGNDVDGDEDTLSVSTINGVAFDPINGVDILGGRLTLITEGDDAGNLLFTPDADYAQDPSFSYTLTDGTLESNEATVDIDITPVNDAPAAPDFDETIAEDAAPIIFDLAEFDVDGDALTVSIGGNALELGDTVSVTGGAVTLLAGNDLQFTADTNFNGAVDFDYTLSDNASVGRTDFENYPVGFETVGGAVSEEGPTGDRVRLSGTGATMQEVFDFVGNSSFVDIHALQPGQPYGPGISGSAMKFDIVWDYTKDVTFEMVADGIGDNEDVYQVLVVDSAGIMRGLITNRTSSGDDGTFNTGNFSFNNGLNDGEAYTFAIVLVNRQNAENMGSMTVDNLRQGGVLLGTPGASTTGSVHIDVTPVNDEVTAQDINDLTVAEDSDGLIVPVFSGPNVDTGETLTVASINGEAFTGEPVAITGGVLTLVEGQLVFTPDADFNGEVSFSYSLTDGTFTSDEAEVSITVTPVNDDPVAENGSGTAVEDTLYEGALAGLATDLEGASLSYSLASQASNGTVVIDPVTGGFTYTPALNFEGTDSFEYTVSDGAGGFDTATFELTVTGENDAPTAAALQYELDEDDAEGVVIDILGDAADPDTGDELSIGSVNGVAFDTVNGVDILGGHLSLITTGDNAGNLLFVADADYNEAVSFDYTVTDGTTESDTATVDIDINPVNDAPVAADITTSMDEDDGSITIDLAEFDVDGDALTVSLGRNVLELGDTVLVSGGSVTLLAGNDLQFTPDENFNGDVDFDYVLSDSGETDTGNIFVDVNPVNDPVVAQPFELTMLEDADGGLVIPVTGVANVDVETLTVATVDGTAFTGTRNIDGGVLTLNVDGNLVFTPDLNFEGAASFIYSLTDGEFTSEEETVDILVNPVNDAPTLEAEPNRSTDEDTIITGQAATPVDVDSEDSLSYVLLSAADGLSFDTLTGAWTFNPTGVSTYQALQVGQTQTVSFTYAAFDGVEQSNAVTVQIAVAGRADVVNGTAGGDGLAGSQFVDIINGEDGNDAISGMDGDDILSGGNGDDVIGAGLGNDQLTGGEGDDTLSGDKGNDLLAGGLGDDFLIGGNGNDTVTYAAATGPVNANLATGSATGEGIDFLVQVENLTGSAFDDTLTGSSTNNLLDGGDGNDLIDGGNGIDTIHGGAGSDSLYGGALGDFLFGGDGDDFLVGGLNSDTMTGGLGADTFIVLQESITGTIETDIILDFNQAEGDILDVSGIDANSTMAGDQAFTFVASHTSNAAGQMTASLINGITILRFYTNADNTVDYQIRVTGDHTLDHVITAGDPVGTGGWLL